MRIFEKPFIQIICYQSMCYDIKGSSYQSIEEFYKNHDNFKEVFNSDVLIKKSISIKNDHYTSLIIDGENQIEIKNPERSSSYEVIMPLYSSSFLFLERDIEREEEYQRQQELENRNRHVLFSFDTMFYKEHFDREVQEVFKSYLSHLKTEIMKERRQDVKFIFEPVFWSDVVRTYSKITSGRERNNYLKKSFKKIDSLYENFLKEEKRVLAQVF